MDSEGRRSGPSIGRKLAGPGPWVALVALAAIVVGLGYLSSHPRKSDADQIVAALQDSIKASKEGRPGGVLDKLANGFQVNNQSVGAGQIANFIRKHHPSVEVLQPSPVVTDDDAHIVSPVKVSIDFLGASRGVTLDNVDIEFHRDPGRVWLIFPASTWHMTKITVPPDALTGLDPLSVFGG